MKNRYLFSILLLALALPAAAEFRTIQRAYEVELNDLRLPQTETGTIAFKTCSKCAYQTTRLAANARWILNGRGMSLAKFRAGLNRVADRKDKYVTVLYHLENDQVTQVSISLR